MGWYEGAVLGVDVMPVGARLGVAIGVLGDAESSIDAILIGD